MESPIHHVIKSCFNQDSIQYPPLDIEWQRRAEDELNETPEKYKIEMATLKSYVLSKYEFNKIFSLEKYWL